MTASVRFDDDRHTRYPATRWSLSHLRELMPTTAVRRGGAPPAALGAPAAATAAAIDALEFNTLAGGALTWDGALRDTFTDGILILHHGQLVYERYFGELLPHRAHACFSITKSYAATLAATLVHERVIDETKAVPFYLPEMAGTAYADATVRQVLDMQVGVDYSENYADEGSPFWAYSRAAGFRPRLPGKDADTPEGIHAFLTTLRKRGVHGVAFDYATVNTEVMCWLMARATGVRLAELLGQRIWSRIGCEEDAYLTVDSQGVAMGGAGLCATLRDLARFGELMRCMGARGSEQIIPAAVVADICAGADAAKFAKAGYVLLSGYSYRNMWWVSHNRHGAFEGRGIFGQRLYVAPAADIVIARFASHPTAASAANDPITMPAFDAVCALLTG